MNDEAEPRLGNIYDTRFTIYPRPDWRNELTVSHAFDSPGRRARAEARPANE